MSTDIKLRKAPLSKIIQSGDILGNMLGNLGKKLLIDLAVPLVKDVVTKLATKAALPVIDKFKRKASRQGAVWAGK